MFGPRPGIKESPPGPIRLFLLFWRLMWIPLGPFVDLHVIWENGEGPRHVHCLLRNTKNNWYLNMFRMSCFDDGSNKFETRVGEIIEPSNFAKYYIQRENDFLHQWIWVLQMIRLSTPLAVILFIENWITKTIKAQCWSTRWLPTLSSVDV